MPASANLSFNRLLEQGAGQWAKGMLVPVAHKQENLSRERDELLAHSGDGSEYMTEECGSAPTPEQATESQTPTPEMMNAAVDEQLAQSESKRHCFGHLSGIQRSNSVNAQSDYCDEPDGQLCSTVPDMENLDDSGSLLDQENPDPVISADVKAGFDASSPYAERRDVQPDGVIVPSVVPDMENLDDSGSLLDQENSDPVISAGDKAGFDASSPYAERRDVQPGGVIIPSVSPDQAVNRSSGRNQRLAEGLPGLRPTPTNGAGHLWSKRGAKSPDGPAVFRMEPGFKQHASTKVDGSLKSAVELYCAIAELKKARDAAAYEDDQSQLRTAGLPDWDRMMSSDGSINAVGLETTIGANTQTSSSPAGNPTLHSTIKTSLIDLVRDNSSWAPGIAKAGEAAAVSSKSGDGVIKMLKVQLQPIELGSVELKLRSVAGETQIEIQVENERAYRALTSDQSAIASVLQGLGGRPDSVSIHLMENNSAAGDGRLNFAERGQHENMGRKNDQNVSDGGDRKPKQAGEETSADQGESSAGTFI